MLIWTVNNILFTYEIYHSDWRLPSGFSSQANSIECIDKVRRESTFRVTDFKPFYSTHFQTAKNANNTHKPGDLFIYIQWVGKKALTMRNPQMNNLKLYFIKNNKIKFCFSLWWPRCKAISFFIYYSCGSKNRSCKFKFIYCVLHNIAVYSNKKRKPDQKFLLISSNPLYILQNLKTECCFRDVLKILHQRGIISVQVFL